jgi:hypothetical protein
MPNRMLTKKEIAEEFMAAIKSECGDDIRKQRAFVYDLQTVLGGFPYSFKERQKYIRTGHV